MISSLSMLLMITLLMISMGYYYMIIYTGYGRIRTVDKSGICEETPIRMADLDSSMAAVRC